MCRWSWTGFQHLLYGDPRRAPPVSPVCGLWNLQQLMIASAWISTVCNNARCTCSRTRRRDNVLFPPIILALCCGRLPDDETLKNSLRFTGYCAKLFCCLWINRSQTPKAGMPGNVEASMSYWRPYLLRITHQVFVFVWNRRFLLFAKEKDSTKPLPEGQIGTNRRANNNRTQNITTISLQ